MTTIINLNPKDPEHAEYLENAIEELLQGECDPYDVSNLDIALANLSLKDLKKLSAYARLGNFEDLGRYVCDLSIKYWEAEAEVLVHDRLNSPEPADDPLPF